MIDSVKQQFSANETLWVERGIRTWQELYAATIQQSTRSVLNLDDIPDAVWELYSENGGALYLDGAWRQTGGHTVFGQVYAGMDVVDAIAAVEVDAENDMPLTPVLIESIDIGEYGA